MHEMQIPSLLALHPSEALFDDAVPLGRMDGYSLPEADPFSNITASASLSNQSDGLFPGLYPVERVLECKEVDKVLRNEMDRRGTCMRMDPRDESPRMFWDGMRYQPTMDLRALGDGDSERIRLYIQHLQQALARTGGFLREAHAEIAELEETINREGWGHAKEDDISDLERKNAKLEKQLNEEKLKRVAAEAKLKKYQAENPYRDALAEKRRENFRIKRRMLELQDDHHDLPAESVVCVLM